MPFRFHRYAQALTGLLVCLSAGPLSAQHTLLYECKPVNTFSYGAAAAALGDLDGDEVPDFAVGAPGFLGALPGQLFLHSGADGSVLQAVPNTIVDTWRLGAALVLVLTSAGSGVLHRLRFPSGQDGQLLGEVPLCSSPYDIVGDLIFLDDRDGDGLPDLLGHHGNDLLLLSSATGAILDTILVDGGFPLLNGHLLLLDDLNGDGAREYLAAGVNNKLAVGDVIQI